MSNLVYLSIGERNIAIMTQIRLSMKTKFPAASPQKFSTLSLDDVPDEVILRVFYNLEIKDLIRCGQVSKRIRAISQDKSLWLKINLYAKRFVATGFLEYVLKNGCQYLGLGFARIDGENMTCNASQLKHLDLSFCQSTYQVFHELLSSCHSLKKLALDSQCHIMLSTDLVKTMCHQFGATLQVLDVSNCYKPYMEIMNLEKVLLMIDSFSQLKEVYFNYTYLSEESLDYICNNLSKNIVKLGFRNQDNLRDEHITALVNRCNKLTSLDLENCSSIGNISATNIIEFLKPSLEELVIRRTAIGHEKYLELQEMPKLRDLICYQPSNKKLIKSCFLT